jgi:hypothetical protein
LQKLGGGCWCWLHIPGSQNGGKFLKQSFDICRHWIWNWLHLVGAKSWQSGGGWAGLDWFLCNQNWLFSPDGHSAVMRRAVKRCQQAEKPAVALSSQN